MSDNGVDEERLAKAVALAKGKKNVVLVVGLTDSFESEGYDRTQFNIPKGHIDLVTEVAKVAKNVILVLVGGSPFAMEWSDNAKAILNAYLSGEAGAEAVVDILSGKVNPSGKLAETWPFDSNDNLADKYFRQGPSTVEYRESIFSGYRYFDAAEKEVKYPFGYGLSYTTFEYKDAKLSAEEITDNDELKVTVTVKNTGKVSGKEIVQVYVSDRESTAFCAKKVLAGFKKVQLEPDEQKEVEILLDKNSFAFFNANTNRWQIESGIFDVLVGANSRDIRKTLSVTINSECKDEIQDLKKVAPEYYNLVGVDEISDGAFAALYGAEFPQNFIPKKGDFTTSSTLQDISGTLIGKMLIVPGTEE